MALSQRATQPSGTEVGGRKFLLRCRTIRAKSRPMFRAILMLLGRT